MQKKYLTLRSISQLKKYNKINLMEERKLRFFFFFFIYKSSMLFLHFPFVLFAFLANVHCSIKRPRIHKHGHVGQRERDRVTMASIRVPETVPSPADDAEQLRKAFEGSQCNLTLSLTCLFATCCSDYECDLLLFSSS